MLNSFLFHHFPTICSSPMCECGEAEQTVFYMVLECKGTSIGNASETIDKLKYVLCRNINSRLHKDLLSDDFSSVLINYSRDANVMSLLSQRVQECFAYLNTTVPSPCLIEIDYSFICSVLVDYTNDANDMSLLSKRVQEFFFFSSP